MNYSQFILTLLMLLSSSQLIFGQTNINISRGWKYRQGDDLAWAMPDFDDGNWQEIEVGKAWEEQGNTEYDGYGWYQIRVSIPEKFRLDKSFRKTRALMLSLGRVDDVDETWFNGRRIGQTGKFPPEYAPNWRSVRKYPVPESLVRWNKENIIAVRVFDGKTQGGMVRGPYTLQSASLADLTRISWETKNSNGLFAEGEPVEFNAIIMNDSTATIQGNLQWIIKDDEAKELSIATEKLTIPAKAKIPLSHLLSPKHPGFYQVNCFFRSETQNVDLKLSKFVGFRPEAIQAPLTSEPDFDEFWKNTLVSLSKIRPQFNLQRKSDYDSKTHEVYEVTMKSLGDIHVRGWYEKPKFSQSVPALLRVPGYGSDMRPTGSDAPMAIFSFNIRAHGNSQDEISGQPENFWIRGLDDKQGYYYQGAYADCIRAVDFLVSRSEIDKKRIGVTGGSQGGGLSLATAALDNRITLCAPDIPFLCDWVKYFKASHWPEINQWIEAKSERTWKNTLRTMSYFDTMNMADRIRCPVMFSLGVQDAVCPPSTIFAVYNRITGPKEFHAYPDIGHEVNSGHRSLQSKWIVNEFKKQASD